MCAAVGEQDTDVGVDVARKGRSDDVCETGEGDWWKVRVGR